MYRQVTLLALFFVIVGLGFLVAATLVSLQTREFVASAVSTTGLVVALEPGHRGYYTVFTYADDHGQPHTDRTDSAEDPAPFRVGSRITALYLPNLPEAARIKSFRTLWLLPAVLWGFGLGITLAGTFGFIAARKTYGHD